MADRKNELKNLKSTPEPLLDRDLNRGLDRREIIRNGGVLGLALGTFSLTGEAAAQGVHGFRKKAKRHHEYKRKNPTPSQPWLDSILPNSKKQVDPAATPHPRLFQTATACTQIGARSRSYCLDRINKGDGSLTPGLKAIEAMVPVCNALAKLSEIDATRLKSMAKTADIFLADCESECRKLATTHPALGACANACAHAKAEIKAVLGT